MRVKKVEVNRLGQGEAMTNMQEKGVEVRLKRAGGVNHKKEKL